MKNLIILALMIFAIALPSCGGNENTTALEQQRQRDSIQLDSFRKDASEKAALAAQKDKELLAAKMADSIRNHIIDSISAAKSKSFTVKTQTKRDSAAELEKLRDDIVRRAMDGNDEKMTIEDAKKESRVRIYDSLK